MEVISITPFWGLYKMVDRMKSNNQEFPHIMEKLKAMEKLVLFLQNKTPDQISEDVKEALDKLNKTVISATMLMKKFEDTFKLNQFVKANDNKAEFENLNKSLTNAFVNLSVALHVHQEEKLTQQKMQLDKQCILEWRLKEQENKIAEQEDELQRVESKLDNQATAYYCVLQ
ncbi:hypothetical protein JOB18_005327 [Solea senegalensis]|uniref:Mixed lineage kinase domain-containing protein n=1 Tax=Solea senegalensis TaxID=28829 RepID=A0AAV6SYP5_SOLSE|nr:hypothetical protein JOB18_005327 [Solea senegalensis]